MQKSICSFMELRMLKGVRNEIAFNESSNDVHIANNKTDENISIV